MWIVRHHWRKARHNPSMTTLFRRGALLICALLAVFAPPSAPSWAASDTFAPPVTPLVVAVAFDPATTRYGPGHRGVDLVADAGTEIHALAAGRVVYAGFLVDRGVVSVEHPGGLRTTYEPVTASVRVGASVAQGQTLGTLEPGHAKCAPAVCLHLGARMPDRIYLDPLALFGPWRVRLKPWSG